MEAREEEAAGSGAREASAREVAPAPERRWLRALGLLVAALSLGIFHTFVLIGIPLALLIVAAPKKGPTSLIIVALIAVLLLPGAPASGLWYVERGWAFLVAAWFAGLTLLWPTRDFTSRALGSVAGGMLAVALVYLVWPEGWTITDWMVGTRLTTGAGTALEAMQLLRGDNALSPALVATVFRTAEFQGQVFPALLALSTFAALGVAWWLYDRLLHGRDSDRGLGALRDFRFNDQLVWVLIAGIALLIWGGESGVQRLGTNVVVFMTMLYAVRGTAVALALSGGISILGTLFLGVGLLVAAPVVFAGALAIGLGDTWLDIRARRKAVAG